jgi:hypothetical protein
MGLILFGILVGVFTIFLGAIFYDFGHLFALQVEFFDDFLLETHKDLVNTFDLFHEDKIVESRKNDK